MTVESAHDIMLIQNYINSIILLLFFSKKTICRFERLAWNTSTCNVFLWMVRLWIIVIFFFILPIFSSEFLLSWLWEKKHYYLFKNREKEAPSLVIISNPSLTLNYISLFPAQGEFYCEFDLSLYPSSSSLLDHRLLEGGVPTLVFSDPVLSCLVHP